MTPEVECYAGSTYPEQPRAFSWEDQHYQVLAVLQRRREPEGVGFLVRCAPGESVFDLFYLTEEAAWKIQSKGSIKIAKNPRLNLNSQGD
ncbi:MAG: hypothetical protein U9R53_01105 [Chloroflexota bacterium]|nr:hypothetical protein [Chloroflexota bacterium]